MDAGGRVIMLKPTTPTQAMSEKQLAALLAKIKDDAGLQEKLKGAADLDAALAMAKEAGFGVSKADWLKYQAKQTLELSDEQLESVAGGTGGIWETSMIGVWCLSFCFCCILPSHAPATTGAFYFFNNYKRTKNDPQYLALSSTSAHNLEPLFPPK